MLGWDQITIPFNRTGGTNFQILPPLDKTLTWEAAESSVTKGTRVRLRPSSFPVPTLRDSQELVPTASQCPVSGFLRHQHTQLQIKLAENKKSKHAPSWSLHWKPFSFCCPLCGKTYKIAFSLLKIKAIALFCYLYQEKKRK